VLGLVEDAAVGGRGTTVVGGEDGMTTTRRLSRRGDDRIHPPRVGRRGGALESGHHTSDVGGGEGSCLPMLLLPWRRVPRYGGVEASCAATTRCSRWSGPAGRRRVCSRRPWLDPRRGVWR
jgi:hypothetical protein